MSKKKWSLSENDNYLLRHLFVASCITVVLGLSHPAFAENMLYRHTGTTHESLAAASEDTVDGAHEDVLGNDVISGWVTVLNMTSADALNSIINRIKGDNRVNPSVFQDLLYALGQVSDEQEEHDTAFDITLYADLIHRYVMYQWIDFNQLTGQIASQPLVAALEGLQKHLAKQETSPTVTALNRIVYGTLYELIYTSGESLFRHHVADGSDFAYASNRNILSFLYELSLVAGDRSEQGHRTEMNTHAYVMGRVWYFLGSYLGQCEYPKLKDNFSEKENKQFYVRYRSLEALYFLFLGENEKANRILNELAYTESAFQPYLTSDNSLDSLVNVIVTGIVGMFGESDENKKSAALRDIFFITKYPFRPQTPSTILDRMNLDAFRAVRKAITPVLNDNPNLLESRFASEISSEDSFERFFINQLKLDQKKSHLSDYFTLKKNKKKSTNKKIKFMVFLACLQTSTTN